jgi:hypothetical protein
VVINLIGIGQLQIEKGQGGQGEIGACVPGSPVQHDGAIARNFKGANVAGVRHGLRIVGVFGWSNA